MQWNIFYNYLGSDNKFKFNFRYLLNFMLDTYLQLIKWSFYDHVWPFFANYISIFHKTEFQTIILRCCTGLDHNWFKSCDTNVVNFPNYQRKNLKDFCPESLSRLGMLHTHLSWVALEIKTNHMCSVDSVNSANSDFFYIEGDWIFVEF